MPTNETAIIKRGVTLPKATVVPVDVSLAGGRIPAQEAPAPSAAPNTPQTAPVNPKPQAPANVQQPTSGVKPANRAYTPPPPIDSSLAGAPGASSAPTEAQKSEYAQKTATKSTTAPETQKSMTYVEMLEKFGPKPMSEEDIAKERKKQRRRMILGALGDGIGALANLYHTAHYAPSAQMPSLSDKMRDRYDKLMDQERANRQSYYERYTRAKQQDDAQARHQEQMDLQREQLKRQEEKDKVAAQKAEADVAYRKAQTEALKQKAEVDALVAQNKISEAEGRARKAQIEADVAEMFAVPTAELKMRKTESEINKNNRYEGSGGSGGKYHGTLNYDGDDHTYKSKADYEDDVVALAQREGVNLNEVTTLTSKAGMRTTKKTTVRRKPIEQLAAEAQAANKARLEREAAEKAAAEKAAAEKKAAKPKNKKKNRLGL